MKTDDFKELDGLPQYEEPELREPKKNYVPEGYDTVEDYLRAMREDYELDIEADDDNRKAALEDKKFVAGEQWDPVVLEQRKGLPCLVINTIPQFTAQLVGDWRTNRVAVKVVPAEGGDVNAASVRSDLIRAIEGRERAGRAYDSAFESMVQCGDGAFRIGVQYAAEDVFDQDITITPIDDALSVVWDRLSVDPTGRDAQHVFVDDLVPRKAFIEQWPEQSPSTLSSKVQNDMMRSGWCDEGTVRVTEHWRMIERRKLLVMFADGNTYAFDEGTEASALEEYTEKHGAPLKTRIAPCRYAQMHLVTGFSILAGPYEYKMNRLPIIRMAGRIVAVGDRRVRYGLVRFMKDAARLRNFWRSVAAEQLGYAPKAQWIAPESAVEGREEAFRQAHLKRDPLLIYNDDALVPPERVEPPAMQMALLNEAQVNTQDMKDVTGIHDASLGIKSNETSGRAIRARQQEGDIASLTYYDNANAAVLEAGDVINQLIGQIYDGTRIVRIIGEDESAKLVTINDDMNPDSPNIATGKYDVMITTGASYMTRRIEAAEAMMEAVQVYPEMMTIAGDLIAKAQDWPGAQELADRLKKTIPPQLLSQKEQQELAQEGGGAQGQDPKALMEAMAQGQEQMAKMQEQLGKLEAENAVLKAKQETEKVKLAIEMFNAETERMKATGQLVLDHREMDHQIQEHEDMLNNQSMEHGFRAQEMSQQKEASDADREIKAKQAEKSSTPAPKPKAGK